MSSGELRIGAEEEFHVVDLETRRSAPEVDALLAQLDGAEFAPELQRSLVETNTPVCDTLDELRGAPAAAAGPAGRRPPSRTGSAWSRRARCRWSTSTAATSRPARGSRTCSTSTRCWSTSSTICGAQVHVDVPDRDEAVQVVRRVAPYLPTLLAISASSPYWRGRDTGYASYRELIWSRWPTAGPPAMVETGAEYDAMIQDLIDSGTISDPGMVYFDVRPSAHVPTVELRVCDACPEVDFVVLIAGLFRALVRRARRRPRAGVPLPEVRHELLRAATWRAARSGLEGDLVDPLGPALVSPVLLVGQLVDSAAPAPGGARRLRAGARAVAGRAGPRQRGGPAAPPVRAAGRAHRRRRRPARRHPGQRTCRSTSRRRSSPRPSCSATTGRPASTRRSARRATSCRSTAGCSARSPRMGVRGMNAAEKALHTEQRARGVTFRVDDEPERLFPLDLMPRIITADDWAGLTAGLAQRVRALEAFLRDVYGERQIVADGVVPASVVDDAPGRSPPGQARAAGRGADRRGRHRPGARPAGPLDGARGQPAGPVRAWRTRS